MLFFAAIANLRKYIQKKMAFEFPLYNTLVRNLQNSNKSVNLQNLADKIAQLNSGGRVTLVALLIYYRQMGNKCPKIVLDYEISLDLTCIPSEMLMICESYCDLHINLMKEQHQREKFLS